MTLDTALAMLSDDPIGALRAMLLVWEERRAVELAEVIEALDAKVGAGRAAPAQPTKTEDKAWIAIAKKRDLADVGRLLALPIHPNPYWQEQRLQTLVKYHGLDARISAAVLTYVESDVRAVSWYTTSGPLLKRFADPRTPTRLRAIVAGNNGPSRAIADEMTRVAERIERAVAKRAPLSAAELATLARLGKAIAKLPDGVPTATPVKRARTNAVPRASAKTAGPVAPILARIDREPEAALVALVDAWRANRHPRIAELIAALGKRVVRPALPTKPAPKALAAWLDCLHAGDPVDADRLIAALRIGAAKHIVERLESLVEMPAHPQFADAAIAILEERPFTSQSTRKLYAAAIAALAAQNDPRTRARLEDIEQHRMPGLGLEGGTDFRDFFAAKITRALTAARSVRPAAELAAEDREALDAALARSRPPDDRTENELLTAIWAAPADDNARAVYADWLQEHGRPHGELITLQLAGVDTPAARRRENQLIAAHWRELLGPLAPAVQKTGLVFKRGFVAHAEIPDRRSPLIEALGQHPAWATLESFYAWETARKRYPKLIKHLRKLGAADLKRHEAKRRYRGPR